MCLNKDMQKKMYLSGNDGIKSKGFPDVRAEQHNRWLDVENNGINTDILLT